MYLNFQRQQKQCWPTYLLSYSCQKVVTYIHAYFLILLNLHVHFFGVFLEQTLTPESIILQKHFPVCFLFPRQIYRWCNFPAIISEWKAFDKSQIAKAFFPLILPDLCIENMLQQNKIQESVEEKEWFKQRKGHSQISLEFKNSRWPKGHLGIERKQKSSKRKSTKKLLCMETLIPLIIMHWSKKC